MHKLIKLVLNKKKVYNKIYYIFCKIIDTIREAAKKVIFLMVRPLRPLPPRAE